MAVNKFLFRFRDELWEHTSFVATDFFTSNNLIKISQEVNIRRHNLKHCNELKNTKDVSNCKNQCV